MGWKGTIPARRHIFPCNLLNPLGFLAEISSRQLKVSKADAGGETVTSVDMLGAKARKEEIARMLGGAKITAKSRAHAEELLREATDA